MSITDFDEALARLKKNLLIMGKETSGNTFLITISLNNLDSHSWFENFVGFDLASVTIEIPADSNFIMIAASAAKQGFRLIRKNENIYGVELLGLDDTLPLFEVGEG